MTIASILFAAGQGKRLRPLSTAIPKPALPVLDVPLGAFGLERLGRIEGTVLVNVGPGDSAVVRALKGFGDFEVLKEEPEAFGTAGTLAALKGRVAASLVTLNSDSLTDLEPGALLESHRRAGGPATIAARRVQSGADLVEKDGRVTEFIDRRVEPGRPGLQFIGACVLESVVIDAIPDHRPAGLAERVLLPLAEKGELAVHLHSGYFLDVGTFERYLRAGLDALDDLCPVPERGWPGRIVEVQGGGAYVGPGATVEPSSLGPGAIVLAGAQVDPAARIQRSVVLPGEVVPAFELADAIWHGGRALPTS